MAKKWWGLRKVVEECSELSVELMKLATFPSGKHPGRKRNLKISTEEELADVLAAVDYFIDKNKLDRQVIERRRVLKYRKFAKWWGDTKPKAKKNNNKRPRVIIKQDDKAK